MYLIRLGGILVSLGITGYLIWAMLSSNSKVDKAIDANPTVVEQKKALKDAGNALKNQLLGGKDTTDKKGEPLDDTKKKVQDAGKGLLNGLLNKKKS